MKGAGGGVTGVGIAPGILKFWTVMIVLTPVAVTLVVVTTVTGGRLLEVTTGFENTGVKINVVVVMIVVVPVPEVWGVP